MNLEQRLYNSIIHRLNEEAEESADEVVGSICRICMQGELAGKLITPCRCAGSIRFVHEECLKAWVLSQGRLSGTACELCQTVYDMDYKIGKVCMPKALIQIREPMSVMLYSLCGVLALVSYLVYTMLGYLWSPSTTTEQAKYVCGLLGLCIFMFLVFFGVFLVVLAKLCVRQSLKFWAIKSLAEADNCESEHSSSVLEKLPEESPGLSPAAEQQPTNRGNAENS